MPTRRIVEPKTSKEAIEMVKRGWLWLMKKYPVFVAPLTLWMLFGGGIFLYNYMSADKFQIKEAKPIGQATTPKISLIPEAVAQEKTGPPIIFNNQLWGYEDTNLEVKAVLGKPILLVHDKVTNRVYEVEFYGGSNYEQKLRK